MMMKEEKELRKWIRENVRNTSTQLQGETTMTTDIKRMLRMTSALIRAVRADEREKCIRRLEDGFDLSGTDTKGNQLIWNAIEIIRKGGE